MFKAIMVFLAGIMTIFFGKFLWDKGDQDERFWQSLLSGLLDIVTLSFFSDYRSSAVLLYLVGILMAFFSILYMVQY